MPSISRPSLPLPEPLRAAEIPSFTNYSVIVRLVQIARRTLAENPFSAETVEQIEALIAEIPEGKVRAVHAPGAADAAEWAAWTQPYEGQNWLEIPWFFAEEYFYRRILEATGYFEAGAWHQRDPYAHQKTLGLTTTRSEINRLADQLAAGLSAQTDLQDELTGLLLADLWGNQNDLSMWPVHKDQKSGGKAGVAGSTGSQNEAAEFIDLCAAQKQIISNDLAAALGYIARLPRGTARIDMLLDNAGYELVTDLVLADYLLSSGRAGQVRLHVKAYPVFVSDALDRDVLSTLDYLVLCGHQSAKDMAVRLRLALIAGRLSLHHHSFWTSPLPAWEMPEDLYTALAASDLLISKGDANYRRLLGDRHWAYDLPFAEVVDYLACTVLALRTLKSEIAVGIAPECVPGSDPEWMTNGRWGLVQFRETVK